MAFIPGQYLTNLRTTQRPGASNKLMMTKHRSSHLYSLYGKCSLDNVGALKRAVGFWMIIRSWGLGAGGELGGRLRTLRHGVLGQVPREEEAGGCLDVPRSQSLLLAVVGETGRLRRQLLEHVVREGVEDGHGLPGDAQVPVHLLHHPRASCVSYYQFFFVKSVHSVYL